MKSPGEFSKLLSIPRGRSMTTRTTATKSTCKDHHLEHRQDFKCQQSLALKQYICAPIKCLLYDDQYPTRACKLQLYSSQPSQCHTNLDSPLVFNLAPYSQAKVDEMCEICCRYFIDQCV